MIRVLHFFKTYMPDNLGGIEQVIFQLCEGGFDHGIESEVLYLSPRGSGRNERVGKHLAHRSSQSFQLASTPFSIRGFKDFRELSEMVDVVHYHFPWPYMDLAHFMARVKKPSVVTYHSDIVKQKNLMKLYGPLMNRFLSGVDAIVASSNAYADSSPVLRGFSDKVSVIPFGLDRASYPAVDSQREDYWRGRLGSRFFLFVGALRYYKGLTYLLRALQGTDIPLVVLGDGLLASELKSEADELGLSNVHFLGRLPDTEKVVLLKLCYGFVFPSHLRSEAFGVSLLEAAMFGKPMISCEIGSGMSDINIDGVTGYAISPADPLALREALLRLWRDPINAQKMGEQALRHYEANFRSSTMLKKYANLYRRIV